MDVKELAQKVKDVRDAQSTYFKNRTPENLEKSKQLERDLDKTVNQILNPQQVIF